MTSNIVESTELSSVPPLVGPEMNHMQLENWGIVR